MKTVSITVPELRALVELLNRAPTTQAEAMWAQSLLSRWDAEIAAQKRDAESENVKDG